MSLHVSLCVVSCVHMYVHVFTCVIVREDMHWYVHTCVDMCHCAWAQGYAWLHVKHGLQRQEVRTVGVVRGGGAWVIIN